MTAKQLSEWRKKNRHSQVSLARALGVNVRQVIRWERGVSPISRIVEIAIQNTAARPESEVGRWPQK